MRARGRRPRDRPHRRTLPPSPRPLWVTYLCRRRRRPRRHERYHFMSFPPFFLARNALISCARNREGRDCLPARSHSEGRDWPPPSLSIHNPFQTNPAAPPFSHSSFRKWLRPYFSPLSASPAPEPRPSSLPSIVPHGAKKAQGSCRVAAPTPAFGAVVGWSVVVVVEDAGSVFS